MSQVTVGSGGKNGQVLGQGVSAASLGGRWMALEYLPAARTGRTGRLSASCEPRHRRHCEVRLPLAVKLPRRREGGCTRHSWRHALPELTRTRTHNRTEGLKRPHQ